MFLQLTFPHLHFGIVLYLNGNDNCWTAAATATGTTTTAAAAATMVASTLAFHKSCPGFV